MGFVEELKRQALEKQTLRQADLSASRQAMEQTKTVIQPKLMELHRALFDLRQTLEDLEPRLVASYELPGIGVFANLVQSDYRLWSEPDREHEKFTFQYAYSRPGAHTLRFEHREEALKMRDWLWLHGLQFEWGDAGYHVIRIRYQIPVAFEFSAVYDKAAIQIRMRNVGAIGSIGSLLNPGTLKVTIVDEIARQVMHQPNELDAHTGNMLSEQQRRWIREQVASERLARELKDKGEKGDGLRARVVSLRRQGSARVVETVAAGTASLSGTAVDG